MVDTFRNNDTAHWFQEHPSLAARRSWENQMEDDEAWRGLTDSLAENFKMDEAQRTYLFHVAGPRTYDASKTIRRLRVTRAAPFKVPAARRFAARVVEYLEEQYEGLDARAYSADVHDPQAVYWMIDFDSTTVWESVRRYLLEDDDYIELMAEGDALFLESGTSELLVNY